MLLHNVNVYLILTIFILSGSPISAFSKRERVNKVDDSLTESEKKELSTMQTVLKEMEDIKEDIQKLAEEELQTEVVKDVTEESLTENKVLPDESKEDKEESEKENKAKEEEKETDKEDEKESGSSTDEVSKSDVTSIETISKENEELSTVSLVIDTDYKTEKEKGPDDTFIVWNDKEKICLLARFQLEFIIIYPSKGGEQKADAKVPKHGTAKGECETNSRSPLLQISWGTYVYTMMFNKTEDNWMVTSMELTYDTSSSLFDGAANPGKKTARSKSLNLFETPMGKSFYCPGEEVVLMYTGNKQVVTARMKEIYLQPYGIEDGQFSTAQRCSKVVIDETPYVQDETVPLAVGCTLALITLLILLGFSFHRAYNAAKVDYNSME